MTTQLSERAKQLIPKARIVSFASWQESQPDELVAIFQGADDEGHYLSDGDLEQIQSLSQEPLELIETAKLLRDRASEIVSEAREKVLAQFPGIVKPGGDLYPPIRAESCWRDFWHFLRCVTYAIAGQRQQFTSEEGLQNMQLLYEELQVPLDAMLCGLENLQAASRQRANTTQDISPYFEHLIDKLSQFK